jgi:hypothetical protein
LVVIYLILLLNKIVLIQKIGIGKTHERIHELYYGITQKDVEWVLSRCAICQQQAQNNNPPSITPIVSRCNMDRVQIDLMDMRASQDGEHKWIMQIKDHFSRYVWLYPLKNKSSDEVAGALKTWLG